MKSITVQTTALGPWASQWQGQRWSWRPFAASPQFWICTPCLSQFGLMETRPPRGRRNEYRPWVALKPHKTRYFITHSGLEKELDSRAAEEGLFRITWLGPTCPRWFWGDAARVPTEKLLTLTWCALAIHWTRGCRFPWNPGDWGLCFNRICNRTKV